MSDRGFIGETEVRLQIVLGGKLQSVVSKFSVRGSCRRFIVEEDLNV
jgi:hypothetical protein